MDADELQVTTSVEHDDVLMAVRGYLDGCGGERLVRHTSGLVQEGHSRLRIDLEAVTLFNCAGARRLATALRDIDRRGLRVELVGVRQTLQKALDLVA